MGVETPHGWSGTDDRSPRPRLQSSERHETPGEGSGIDANRILGVTPTLGSLWSAATTEGALDPASGDRKSVV